MINNLFHINILLELLLFYYYFIMQIFIFYLPRLVISGRNLIAKNSGNRSDPYCEVVTLDSKGVKIGKAQLTKVIKANLNPKWDQLVEL